MSSCKWCFFALFAALSGTASSQGVTVGTASGPPNGTAIVSLGYAQENDLRNFQIVISYDESVLSPQTTTDATFGELIDGCPVDLSGVNWDASQTRCIDTTTPGTIAITVSSGPGSGSPALESLDPFGSITFDIDEFAPVGAVVPLDVTVNNATQTGTTANDPSLLSTVPGSVTIEITGAAGFASSPQPNSTIDLGSAIVGNLSSGSPSNIAVSEVGDQQLQVTAFPFTGSNPSDFSTSATAFNIDDGGDPVNVPVSCTPNARGMRTATFEISNNSSNAPSAQYTLECTGLAPNVLVSPLTQDLAVATVPGSSDSDTFTVTNDNSDGFSSSTDVTISLSALSGPPGTPPTVNVSPLNFTLDPGDDRVVTSECSSDASTTPGTYTLTATVGFTAPGMIIQPEVTVECVVSEIAPGYSSNPPPTATLPFGQVENGATSAAQTIEIGNENSVGSGSAAELQITGAVLSDSTNYSFSPDPFTATLPADAPNGTASIDVFCTPQSIGDFSGETLTVQTDVGDQEYDLTCEGTSNANLVVTPAGALDGTFSIGSVPPGNTGSGSLTLGNSGTDPLDISCTLTDDNAGIIAFNPVPSFPVTVPPNSTLTFEGTPPDISSFQETLECTVTDPSVSGDPTTFTTTIVVTGRPLIIPTLSQWGLLALMLSLLLAGGLAARRTMA